MIAREMDERNRRILADRVAKLDQREGPRVGDWVVFADGVIRRVSYVWDWGDPGDVHVQTSDDGSFYLGDGYVSFSGSLHSGVPGASLTLTGERRSGSVWFFRDDLWEANNGIHAALDFRVYTSSVEAPA